MATSLKIDDTLKGRVQHLAAIRDRSAHWIMCEAIRAYVAAADASPVAAAPDYAGWRTWALAQAEAMDPLLDGSAPFARLPPIEDWTWRGR